MSQKWKPLKMTLAWVRYPQTSSVQCGWIASPLFKVYISHTLSAWGDRLWLFASGIFLKDLEGSEHTSLKLTAIFTFVLSGAVVISGATVGRWVDSTARLKAVQISLIVQNISTAVCAGIVCYLFYDWDNVLQMWNGWYLTLMQGIIIATAAIAKIASKAGTIVIQRDWVVVLCENDLDKLANTNSVIRTIDLTTDIVAPIFVGVIQDTVSKPDNALIIAAWNIASMFLEYFLLHWIYHQNENLAKKSNPLNCEKPVDSELSPEKPPKCDAIYSKMKTFINDWAEFFKHKIMFAGISLAFLYMTVLAFDPITTGYASIHVQISVIAGANAASALCGVSGSIAFPFLRKCLGLGKVGIIGLVLQVLMLTLCVISVWLPGSPSIINSETLTPSWTPEKLESDVSHDKNLLHIYFLFGGIILSRFGLWLTDITVTQLMQEQVAEHQRGVISGVQDSLNMLMDMLKSVLVFLYPYPQQYGFLIIISFIFICLGLINYMIYWFCFYSKSVKTNDPAQPAIGS